MRRRITILCVVTLGIVALVASAAPLAQAAPTLDPDAWITNGQVRAIAEGPDGITYIGGSFTYVGPPTGFGVPLSPTSGDPSATFPRVDGSVLACAADGAGGFYIGGSFTVVGGEPRNRIAHILADGTLDPTFDPNADRNVYALAVGADGTVYAGGRFLSIGGQPRNRIAALDASGKATDWDPNANNSVYSLVAGSDGTVYAGGDFLSIGGALRGGSALFVTEPTVSTVAATAVTSSIATANGSVVSGPGTLASVSDRGVYVSTTAGFTPPAQGTRVTASVPTGSGSFACSLTGLAPSTTYYVRAYATNGVGTTYGEQVSFTTAAPDQPTLTLSGADGAWRKSPVTLTCTATLDPLTSLTSLQYRSRAGSIWSAWQDLPGSGSSRSLTISGEGQTDVEARVTDSAGGGAVASAMVKIDSVKPTTRAYAASVWKGRKVKLAYRVNDASPGCGQATVTLKVFKGAKLKKTIKVPGAVACNLKKAYNWKCTLPKGHYTFKVYATDLAGNAQSKVGGAKLTVR